MISEEQVKRDEELCAAASPAPWAWDEREWTIESAEKRSIIETDCRCYGPEDNDAAFIIRSRTALPEYIAYVGALQDRHKARDETMAAICDALDNRDINPKSDGQPECPIWLAEEAARLVKARTEEVAKLRGLLEKTRGYVEEYGNRPLLAEIAEALGK